MTRQEVLIIGAGPTGLMMACQLAMRNISFRIIDKTQDHTTQSRALIIHARSLEIFQQMGISEKALQQGKIAKAVNLIVNGKRKLRFGLRDIGNNLTDFPFLLILEQSKTETILNNFLHRFGKQVERNTELLQFSQNQNAVISIIQNKNGGHETIETNWLIGADGAHSIVREHLAIPFLGKTYQQSLFVLDCEVNLNFPPDEMYLSFSDKTFAGFFPMTNGRCRIIGLVPEEIRNKEEITFEEVNKTFAAQTHLNITLQNPLWISKYHSHHRVVSAFRKGNCFLTGDAAHIHSPVGAQGMNTGLQDAYNLAWKLASVIQRKANENLLNTYEDERIEIAKKLVRSTDRAFHFVTSENRFFKFYRMQVIPFILKLFLPIAQKISFIKKTAFLNISEIALNYRNSKLSQQDKYSFSNISLKSGDRVPYNFLRKDFTSGISFHLLLFSKNNLLEDVLGEFQNVCQSYDDNFIKINEVAFNNDTENIYKQFGIKSDGFYLIRPDSYIAYRSKTLDAEKLKRYLQTYYLCLCSSTSLKT
jgi:2-polyprenyl-6-methoxyphenol hydroxylase-like FAD-dependent oxidoreductase